MAQIGYGSYGKIWDNLKERIKKGESIPENDKDLYFAHINGYHVRFADLPWLIEYIAAAKSGNIEFDKDKIYVVAVDNIKKTNKRRKI